jgi:hypothetical protein
VYSEMSNEELKRVIAERLGWKVEQWVDSDGNPVNTHSATSPDGKQARCCSIGEHTTYDDALRCETIPQWPTSTDAALGLLGANENLALAIDGNSVCAVVTDEPASKRNLDYECGASDYQGRVARTICLAWLAWSDAQSDTSK